MNDAPRRSRVQQGSRLSVPAVVTAAEGAAAAEERKKPCITPFW